MKWLSPLFTRILLWFVGLLLLSIAGLIATTIWLAPPPPMGGFGGLLKAELEEAIWSYEHGGAEGLRGYVGRRDRILAGQHLLLDARGQNLVTGEMQSELLSGPAERPRPRFPWPGRVVRPPVMRVASVDGRYHYVIAGMRLPGTDSGAQLAAYLWVVLLVVVLCYVLAMTLARPIGELREAVLGFGGGDLRRRAQVKRKDEFGELGLAFNEMADRIQTLLTAERRLLQDVSHELRTPLARLGFAVELARTSPDPRAAMGRIKREADRVTELVNALIEMARAEGDPLERKNEAIDVSQLLHGLLEDLRPEAERKQVRLQGPAVVELWVRGDAGLLERALGNVVTNAIRYAPDGTAVEVSLTAAAGGVAIAVRDQGPGVPEQHLKAIFQPFFRVDESRDRASGGVGLGLAITQRTALLHHGELRAENAHPGLRVTLTLPVQAGVRPAAADPAAVRSA